MVNPDVTMINIDPVPHLYPSLVHKTYNPQLDKERPNSMVDYLRFVERY